MDKDIPAKFEARTPIDTLDAAVARKARQLVEACARQGILIEVVSGYRSYAQQQRLYDQGRTRPGRIVTHAKPGRSWHNFRLAFDVAFKDGAKITYNGPYKKVAAIAKTLGLEWGGDWKTFKDYPHFQDRKGMTLSQAQYAWEKLKAHEAEVARKMRHFAAQKPEHK